VLANHLAREHVQEHDELEEREVDPHKLFAGQEGLTLQQVNELLDQWPALVHDLLVGLALVAWHRCGLLQVEVLGLEHLGLGEGNWVSMD